MAHWTLHFAVGAALGTALCLPRLFRAWRSRRPLAMEFSALLLASYLLGAWAVVPHALRNVAWLSGVSSGWWTNVFVFHRLIDAFRPGGGMVVGELALAALFVFHYSLLLSAIRTVTFGRR